MKKEWYNNRIMQKYLVRHGLSQANNHENFGTPLFGSADAELMEEGKVHAREAGRILLTYHGFNPATTRVATSRMRRTQQTAEEAGFSLENSTAYPLLDEVTSYLSFEEIAEAIQTETPPSTVIEQVEALLSNPPEEPIWFTHGFVIAAISHVLNAPSTRFIPHFGEVREIQIG